MTKLSFWDYLVWRRLSPDENRTAMEICEKTLKQMISLKPGSAYHSVLYSLKKLERQGFAMKTNPQRKRGNTWKATGRVLNLPQLKNGDSFAQRWDEIRQNAIRFTQKEP